ncbi:MAG: WbuC family cupin fold metalloprotein [Thiohalomonadaceae bacterium]
MLKRLDQRLFDDLAARARAGARGRTNENLHAGPDDPVQRFLNAIEPDSYVRPHRHTAPPRWELFTLLAGSAVVLVFDDEGKVLAREEVSARGPLHGLEIPAGIWHGLAARESGTVLLELKPGPYRPAVDKDFAPWAPREGDPDAPACARWLIRARPGERFVP